jgi:hypothetical protein
MFCFFAALVWSGMVDAAPPAPLVLSQDRVAAYLEDEWEKSAVVRREQGPAAAEAQLRGAAERVMESLGAEHDVSETLRDGFARADEESNPSARLARISVAVVKAQAAANFRPKMEAPLPAGFPQPGPVGQVIVKQYPAYRAARTTMRDDGRGQNSAFNKLFRHITSNDVKMTAPVEMRYDNANDAASPEPVSMAFLYEAPDQGMAGTDGAVEVVDLPAMTVVSVGIRGSYTTEQMQRAKSKLDGYLKQHAETLRADGPPRYMGYNSPFVLPHLRYGEVQIPVKRTDNASK